MFRTDTRRATIGLAEIRAALPADTALVSFFRYDRTVTTSPADPARAATARTIPSYIAFVLRAGGSEPVAVRLGSAATIDGAITAWRDELVAGVARQPVDLAAAEKALRVPGAALRRRIWDPVATHLDGATRVFVVSDSAINLVPFAALPAAIGGYLLERGPVIHYLSAERDLAAPQPSRPATPGALLAVGGPAFSTRQVFASAGTKAGPAASPRPAASSPRGGHRHSRHGCGLHVLGVPIDDFRSPAGRACRGRGGGEALGVVAQRRGRSRANPGRHYRV